MRAYAVFRHLDADMTRKKDPVLYDVIQGNRSMAEAVQQMTRDRGLEQTPRFVRRVRVGSAYVDAYQGNGFLYLVRTATEADQRLMLSKEFAALTTDFTTELLNNPGTFTRRTR